MIDAPALSPTPPWHEGEVALQASVGMADRMADIGSRMIRAAMPDQHRDFYAQLPFMVAATVDGAGDAWATLLTGPPGFVQSPDDRTLAIAAALQPADPADAGLSDGDAIGLLGIELHSRRRNRINGRIRRQSGAGFTVTVEQSFGNCPQYIQRRDWHIADAPPAGGVFRSHHLDAAARALVAAADTFFIASYADLASGRQVDASHRGGKAGFVRIDSDGTLTIPDFSGNRHFNTLGNILINPRAGLTFVDFESGDLLQLTGDAAIIFDSPEIAAFHGAERVWRFRPRQVVRRPAAIGLRWAFRDWSPVSLRSGSWEMAALLLRD